MSNAGPSSSAEPREDTPLLQADASPTSAFASAPHDDGDAQNDQESQHLVDDARRQAALARVDKALKKLFSLTISTGTVAVAFNIAYMVLQRYGTEMFGYYAWNLEEIQWSSLLMTIIGVAFSIFNLYHSSQRPHPLSAFLKILVFTIDGILTIGAAARALESDVLIGTHCRRDLDDEPPEWGYRYPGSYKECRDWEPAFQIVSWLWLCFEVVVGLAMLAVGIASLVRVYKLRNTRSWANTGVRNGSRWTIPAGQVSFEVSVYWGAPAPAGAGRPRQGENEPAAVGEGTQEA